MAIEQQQQSEDQKPCNNNSLQTTTEIMNSQPIMATSVTTPTSTNIGVTDEITNEHQHNDSPYLLLAPDGNQVINSSLTDTNTDINEALEVQEHNTDTVTSVMLAPDGSQIINIDGEQCGLISVEELASKLGLPDNISLASLLRPLSGGLIRETEGEMGVNELSGSGSNNIPQQEGLVDNVTTANDQAQLVNGILLDSASTAAVAAGDIDIVPLEIGKQDTIQLMEVLVPDTGESSLIIN